MELSLREAATRLHRSERTLRDQLIRGIIRGTKINGRWTVREADLPVDEAGRQAQRARADAVRATVEKAISRRLPPMTIEDVELFRLGRDLLRRLPAEHAAAIGEAIDSVVSPAGGRWCPG